jgi:hypothetical protein
VAVEPPEISQIPLNIQLIRVIVKTQKKYAEKKKLVEKLILSPAMGRDIFPPGPVGIGFWAFGDEY